jgi:hypothetical protein
MYKKLLNGKLSEQEMLGLIFIIQKAKFVSFLEKQTEEMTALMKKLGVI